MEETVTHVRLSLDIDGHSYGADETYSVENFTAIDELIDNYIDFYVQRILEIHSLPEDEEIQNPRQYVDVTYVYED